LGVSPVCFDAVSRSLQQQFKTLKKYSPMSLDAVHTDRVLRK